MSRPNYTSIPPLPCSLDLIHDDVEHLPVLVPPAAQVPIGAGRHLDAPRAKTICVLEVQRRFHRLHEGERSLSRTRDSHNGREGASPAARTLGGDRDARSSEGGGRGREVHGLEERDCLFLPEGIEEFLWGLISKLITSKDCANAPEDVPVGPTPAPR